MANQGLPYQLWPLLENGGDQADQQLPSIRAIFPLLAAPPRQSLPPKSTVHQSFPGPLIPSSSQVHHSHPYYHSVSHAPLAQPRAQILPNNRQSCRWLQGTYWNTAPPTTDSTEPGTGPMKVTYLYEREAEAELQAITGAGPSSSSLYLPSSSFFESSLSVGTQTNIHYNQDETGELDINLEALSPCRNLAPVWPEINNDQFREGILTSREPRRWQASDGTQTERVENRSPWVAGKTLMNLPLPSMEEPPTPGQLAAPSVRYRLHEMSLQSTVEEVSEVPVIPSESPQEVRSASVSVVEPPPRSAEAIKAMMSLDALLS